VEYSSSSWADDALLRLVQLDYASGNLEGAARNLERIRLDYPGSTLLPQASYWAARTYFDQKNPEQACRWIAEGIGGARGNVELQNQLGYLNQRCSQFAAASRPTPSRDSLPAPRVGADSPRTVGALPPDSAPKAASRPDSATTITLVPETPTPSPPPSRRDTVRADPAPPPPPAARSGARFRVQITAVRNVSTARSIAAKLKSRGFNVVTVEEGGLYKVRVGEYATKADAVEAVPAIKAKLGGSPFVVTES
jgi:septal ring-binding cell division protein DamX